MITFGEDKYKPALMEMWKLCFPQDADEFIRFYFDKVYKNEEILIFLDNKKPVASLQMIPYPMLIDSDLVASFYISGVMTHPGFREKGYMSLLLNKAFEVMKKAGFYYTFLIPQEDWLIAFYEKYGFEKAFPRHESTILLPDNDPEPPKAWVKSEIVQRFSSLDEIDFRMTFSAYCEHLDNMSDAVLKTMEQLRNILEDHFISGGSFFMNVWGVLFAQPEGDRVIIKEFLCEDKNSKRLFAEALRHAYPGKELMLLDDPDKPFFRYKGMIKPLNDKAVIPPYIYMNMMLD